MIKGLGHLIRTMFGGKRPAPALPSHMVGAVEGETVHAPLASDDVLRRAMEAAGETADMPIPQAERSGQYLHPRAEDVGTLPTLFLHGKAAEPEVLPEVLDVSVVVPELSAEVLLTVPEYAAAPEIVIESGRAEEAVASRPPQLETLMSFQEIVQAPRFSELALVMTEWGGHSERIQRPVTAHVPAAAAPAIVQAPPVQPVVQEEAPVVASVTLGPLNAEVFAAETLDSEKVLQADPVEDPHTEEMLPEEAVAEEKLADDAAVTEAAPPKSPSRRKAEPGTTTRRKKSAKALPEDAVWLTDAVIWTQCGSWREFWLPPTDPESSARVEEFRTLAAEGKLTVWGRTGEASEWAAIAASHWKKAGFDPLAFLAGRENAFSQAPVKKSRTKPPADPVRYDSLMVSRAAVEELWAAREEHQAAVA